MSRKNRVTVTDLAQEAGISESKAIELLRKNGMEARVGFRISGSNLQRAREILHGGKEAATANKKQGKGSKPSDEAAAGVQPNETGMTLRDVVDAWLRNNPGPKHLVLEGRSYNDFIEVCYQRLLADALKQGVSAEDIVTSEDRKHIEAFLHRGKAAWNSRCQKEEAKADARQRAEARRQAEERRAAEELDRAVIERQARMLQEQRRLFEERQRQAEARQKREEQRVAEARRQQEAQRQADLAAHNNEQARREQILSKHSGAVSNERARLQAGQCSPADYYGFVLRDRIERSAELLFGSAQQPSYDLLQKNPALLDKLKRNLSFADDKHPGDYHDPYVSAYYTLRYELGYAFEYSQIYGMLLGIMRQEKEDAPFDVLSIGSGQGLDYWGLRYALAKQEGYRPRIGWRGVDLETWPDHVLQDDVAEYFDGTDVCEFLGSMSKLDAKVVMFPKVICELPGEVINYIASWLERVDLTRDVHYLCFAHTERKSLNPSDSKRVGPNNCFHYPADSSLDAVKSAFLIDAACNGADRQFYSAEPAWYNRKSMQVSDYDVVWSYGQNGEERRSTYPYLNYGERNASVGEDDPTFAMSRVLREAVHDIGYSCCDKFMPSGSSRDCDTSHVRCDNSGLCPLYRYPRFRTDRIAYQIVRLVNEIPF